MEGQWKITLGSLNLSRRLLMTMTIAPSGGTVKGQSRIAAEVESQSVSAARARSQPKLADVSRNSNLFLKDWMIFLMRFSKSDRMF